MVEASLGGRVTADEIRVFGEELCELLEAFENRPFNLLLDYSKAKRLDSDAVSALSAVKDGCFDLGATEIVSITTDEQDMVMQQSFRLQQVLEGKERFVSEPSQAKFAPFRTAEIRLAA